MTCTELVTGSLKLIGVLAAGETPNANDAEDARLRLNDFLDYLATQRLTVFNQERSVYPLVSGTADYTIGDAGDFDQARPVWIDGIGLVYGGYEYPLRPLTKGEWQRVSDKTLQGLPGAYYFNDNHPLGELSFYPVPDSTQSYEVAVYWPSSSLTEVATLATTISTPPGWARMLRSNLACELAPEFGAAIPPKVEQMAAESMAAVKRSNIRPEVLTFDRALTGRRGGVSRTDFTGGNF